MKLFAMRERKNLRAWELREGERYLLGSGTACHLVIDPRICPWEALCQVEVEADRLRLSAVPDGVDLLGPKGSAPLVVLRHFEKLTVGPVELGALDELVPLDHFDGQAETTAPTAPSDGVAPPGPKKRLFLKVANERGTRLYELRNRFQIGRAEVCFATGLHLVHPAISAIHAMVLERGHGFVLVDNQSDHGTFVNSIRLAPGVELPLESGQVIALTRNPRVVRIDVLDEDDLRKGMGGGELIGDSPAMRKLRAQIHEFGSNRAPALVTGEPGTGKELVGDALAHRVNPRKGKAVVDCTTLTEATAAAELGGARPGAYTGAVAREGLIDEAEGGLLYLDEIGDLPLPVQAMLLRFLEESTVRPVGGNKWHHVDCRVAAATNRDLEQFVVDGRFRQDLFDRLNGQRLRTPPLRERKEDIQPIAEHFLSHREAPGARKSLTTDALLALHDERWPGNVRELLRVLEIAAGRTEGVEIAASTVREVLAARTPGAAAAAPPSSVKAPDRVRAFERSLIADGLARRGGSIPKAAADLGYSVNTLRRRVEEYGLEAAIRGADTEG